MSSVHRPVNRIGGLRGLAVVAVVCLLAAGCAASGALRRGRDAERRQEFDLAVVEYTKALRLRPSDTTARVELDRAKLRASQEHFNRGRRLSAAAELDGSRGEDQRV